MVISSTVLKSLFLSPLLLIGVITSYSDIKYGKIKNIHLLFGLLYILSLYSFLIFYSYFVIHQPSNLKYVVELLINSLIAFVVGYLLWHFNSWAAGDAKLFSIYSLLIPLEFYSKNYVPYFPSSILLIDTFLFICFVFFLKIFFKIAASCLSYFQKPFSLAPLFLKINYKILKTTILETGKLFLIYSCFLVILQYIGMKTTDVILQKVLSNFLLIYLFFFALQMFVLRTFLKNKIFITLILLSGLLFGLAFIISNKTILLITTIKTSLFFVLFVGIGMQLVNLYIEKQEIKKTKIQELHPGCFLTSKSLAEINNKIKGQTPVDNLGLTSSDGLTEFQVQIIKDLFKNHLKKELYIYETFPFAPFMFLAFIFIILAKGSFLFFLLHLWDLFK